MRHARWWSVVRTSSRSFGSGGDPAAQKRLIGNYTISDDGRILALGYTVRDPVYLTERLYSMLQQDEK